MTVAVDVVDVVWIAVEDAGPRDGQEVPIGAGAQRNLWTLLVKPANDTVQP